MGFILKKLEIIRISDDAFRHADILSDGRIVHVTMSHVNLST